MRSLVSLTASFVSFNSLLFSARPEDTSRSLASTPGTLSCTRSETLGMIASTATTAMMAASSSPGVPPPGAVYQQDNLDQHRRREHDHWPPLCTHPGS